MNLTTLLTTYGGAILGSLVGVLGGVLGTWASIRNTRTPSERSFMIRCALAIWVGVVLFLVALLLIPQPYNYLLWVPYVLLLVFGISWINKRQASLRGIESKSP